MNILGFTDIKGTNGAKVMFNTYVLISKVRSVQYKVQLATIDKKFKNKLYKK